LPDPPEMSTTISTEPSSWDGPFQISVAMGTPS
jgi:hypothetical protein